MELDERKAAILRAIVEEHISTAQPVGSQTIARSRGLGVSSATVRNEMTVLEREGFLVQPHTSAGRVPTDRGYRFFVDNFERQPGLAPAQRRAVSDFFTLFASAHQVLEDLLNETSQLLARVSTHTAVVVGPHQIDAATVRSVQLVNLQPSLVLALAILSNGSVEKCVLHVAADTDDTTIATAGALLDTQLSGARWAALPELRPVAGPAADTLAREA
ncbi:MAG: heat-inducible transcriptional repressor, partial [Acidimicrobiaceae bacterium]